jgi:hypothetical protein
MYASVPIGLAIFVSSAKVRATLRSIRRGLDDMTTFRGFTSRWT